MFKHIILCLILASAMNSFFLKRLSEKKKACKRVKELTKEIKKLNDDKNVYQAANHKEVNDLKAQIEKLKHKISVKEAHLKDYLVTYAKTKSVKEAELNKVQQICKKCHGGLLGTPRKLQKEHNSRRRNNRRVNHKGGKYSAWANKQKSDAKIAARSSAKSDGRGQSSASAGPNGSQSTAKGTDGVSTDSNFKADIKHQGSSFGVNSSKKGNQKWSTTTSNHTKVDGSGEAKARGKASAGSQTGFDGTNTFAHGSRGTNTAANWNGNNKNDKNSWEVSREE
jgi:hypothetical protein